MTAEQKNKQGTPVPLYLQVKQSIIEKIHTAKWRANDRIPSESELVSQFQCSRMTANRALRELTAEGLLVRLQGSEHLLLNRKGSLHYLKFTVLKRKLLQETINTAAGLLN